MKKFLSILMILTLTLSLFACNKAYVDYMEDFDGYEETIGSSTNDESIADLVSIYSDETAQDINVLPVENLDDDFIFGVDISMVLEVEKNGGKYYDEDGQERDVFEILKEHGVNYVRIRLWNQPYNEDGEDYGGGNNDIETDLELAKRAARVGMRILLDFHYSDFWADPSKQTIPRAWADLTEDEVEDAFYQFTYDTIKRFEDEGVRPHMVQIGNEINNGFIWPIAPTVRGYGRIAKFIQLGIDAVHAVSPDIRTAIHLANGATESSLVYFFDEMIENNVDFDIIGLSYYSYWHGPMTQFEETLQALDERYDQDIAVLEYSYGFTDLPHENASNIYSSDNEASGGYKTSMQGQASYIRDVNNAVASIDSGIGTFYWEPAWLPVAGAGWATEGARTYLAAQGDDGGLGTVSWANQALFSYSGKVLPSMNVFNLMRTSTYDSEEILSYDDQLSILLNLRSDDGLPSTTTGYTSLDRRTQIPITWDQEEVDLMTSPGTYTIHGTIPSGDSTLPVTITVEAFENFIVNPSFEDDGRAASDIKDFSLITGWDVIQNVDGTVKVESKNPRQVDNAGVNNINIYATSAFTFTLYQDTVLVPGEYRLSVWARSNNDNADRPAVVLFYGDGETIIGSSTVTYGGSWSEWVQTVVTFTVTEEATYRIGIQGSGDPQAWAHFDDFGLQKLEQ